MFHMQVKLLESLGLPTHWVCNMASRAPAILGRDPQSELQPVIDYIQKQGLTGKDVIQFQMRTHDISDVVSWEECPPSAIFKNSSRFFSAYLDNKAVQKTEVFPQTQITLRGSHSEDAELIVIGLRNP